MKKAIASFTLTIMYFIIITPCVHGEKIELTAGIYKGGEPLYTIDEINGKSEIFGMNIEIINAFVRKAPEFQFIYKPGLPASRLFYYLEKNIIQVVFGVAKNAEREKLYQYADIPLYPVKFSIIVRADDTDVRHISSLEDIRHSGGTVLGFSGSSAIKLFEKKTEHLGIPIEVAPSIEQNFNKLLKGRGRYFVFNHYSLIDGAKMLGYQNKIAITPLCIGETYHWLAFSKEIPRKVVQKANAALRELKESGELKSIYEKYGKLQ